MDQLNELKAGIKARAEESYKNHPTIHENEDKSMDESVEASFNEIITRVKNVPQDKLAELEGDRVLALLVGIPFAPNTLTKEEINAIWQQ